MNKTQMRKFVKRHGGNNIKVIFSDTGWYAAQVLSENVIAVNLKIKLINWGYRELLLHEIGHIKGETLNYSSVSKSEYVAQKWAIEYSKNNRMGNISKNLIRAAQRWANMKWNSENGCWRKYILAAKKLLKELENKD